MCMIGMSWLRLGRFRYRCLCLFWAPVGFSKHQLLASGLCTLEKCVNVSGNAMNPCSISQVLLVVITGVPSCQLCMKLLPRGVRPVETFPKGAAKHLLIPSSAQRLSLVTKPFQLLCTAEFDVDSQVLRSL